MIEPALTGLYRRHVGKGDRHIPAVREPVTTWSTEDEISCLVTPSPKSDLIPKPEDFPRRTMAYLLLKPGDIRDVNPAGVLWSLRRARSESVTHLSDCLDGSEPFAQLYLMTGKLNIAIRKDIRKGTLSLQAYDAEIKDRSLCEKWKLDSDKREFDEFLKGIQSYWYEYDKQKIKARGWSDFVLFNSIDPAFEKVDKG